MDETVQRSRPQYPNVTIETTLYETGKWIQTQQTACQSGSGPDLWYNWSGTWSLEPAWKGCTVPNEEILSRRVTSTANPNVPGDALGGPDVGLPSVQVRLPGRRTTSRSVEQAGLDPRAPPTTWDDLMAALETIKASGITPFALGLKDGFGGEILAAGQLEKQWVNGPDDNKQLVIDGNFATDPDWTGWLEKAFELKPYFNEDANSLGFAEGLALWQAGRPRWSSVRPASSRSSRRCADEGKQVGLLKVPPFDDGAWADSLVNTGNGFQVTQWSENKEVAGAFMAFLQAAENLQALYEATGNFPTSTNWDSSPVTSQTDQPDAASGSSEKSDAWWAANYTPGRPRRQRHVRRVPEDDGGRDRHSRLGSALPGRDHEVARGESRRRRELPIMAGLLTY